MEAAQVRLHDDTSLTATMVWTSGASAEVVLGGAGESELTVIQYAIPRLAIVQGRGYTAHEFLSIRIQGGYRYGASKKHLLGGALRLR